MPYAELADPQSLNLYSYVRNIPTTHYDKDGHCPAGDTNCQSVKVTVEPPKQDAVVVPIKDDKKLGTGIAIGAAITGTVTVEGKPTDGVKVTETNQETRTINGKDDSRPPIEGKGVTKDGGKYTDNIGYMQPTNGSAKQNAKAEKMLDKAHFKQVDIQKLTLTFSDGSSCNFTSTRTLTNIDSQGNLTNYSVTTTQPVPTDAVPK